MFIHGVVPFRRDEDVRARFPDRIGIDEAMKLCDKYHITLDWIYRGHDSMLPEGFAKRLQEVIEREPDANA